MSDCGGKRGETDPGSYCQMDSNRLVLLGLNGHFLIGAHGNFPCNNYVGSKHTGSGGTQKEAFDRSGSDFQWIQGIPPFRKK